MDEGLVVVAEKAVVEPADGRPGTRCAFEEEASRCLRGWLFSLDNRLHWLLTVNIAHCNPSAYEGRKF
jgi:hypothetical protein